MVRLPRQAVLNSSLPIPAFVMLFMTGLSQRRYGMPDASPHAMVVATVEHINVYQHRFILLHLDLIDNS